MFSAILQRIPSNFDYELVDYVVVASRNKGRKASKKQRSTNLSPNAVSYSGPISVPGASRGEEVITQVCPEIIDIAWTGLTTSIFTQITSVGSTSSYTDNYGNYREYRCLGMSAEFVPLFQALQTNETGAINSGLIVASSIEKTPAGTAFLGTTLIQMVDNASMEIHSPMTRVSRIVRMNGTEEAAWASTAIAAVSQFSIGLILDTRANHTPSANVAGTLHIKRLMQWRNKFN